MKDFVITIGRQFGSGGRELGRIISQKLNIPFYDRELIYQAAQEAGLSPEFFANNDERVPTFINGSIPFSFGVNPMAWHSGPSAISDDNLYRMQSDFIHSIAAQGSCIIVGRTADYVLRDLDNVVNVFVHANMDDCIDRIMRRSDTHDRAKAQKMAERINKIRANYYNFYTDKTWGHSSSYDLTFNSSTLPMEEIADIIIDYCQRRFRD